MRRYLSDEEKELEKLKKIEDQVPEHTPVVPYNMQIEKQKEENRKKVAALRKKLIKIEPIVITIDGLVKKASELNVSEQYQEIVRCASDPIYFIETYLTIFDQTSGNSGEIVPFKLFPFQKLMIIDYQKDQHDIVNKYRQAGISTATCAFISWYIMFNLNRSVAIVADKLETARDELMNDVVDFISNCPAWLRPKTGKETEKVYKDTQKLKRYDNGSTLGAFSSKGLRGYTPTLLFWDETAWTEKGDKFWTSAQPTLQTGGKAIMVSCVTKDTYLYTNKGIKQISDFISSNDLGAHIVKEYNVLGKDKLRKGNIFFNNGYVDTLKITSKYSTLESSYNHKYWAYKKSEKKYDWYMASELEIDDYISIQHGMNIWGNNDDCSDFKPTISYKTKNFFNPKKITTDIAYLIGLYISEGCGNKRNNRPNKYYGITITCGDDLTETLTKLNLNYNNKDRLHYEIGSLNVSEFLEYLGFDLSKKANEKIIPSRLLEMSRKNIIAMIQGIMDGDGWTNYKTKSNNIRIGIGLSSKILMEQLRILFGNFGILTDYNEVLSKPTKLVKVSSMNYRIVACGGYAEKYFTEIGFRFERKQNVFLKYDKNKLKHIGVSDNIPNGANYLYEIYQKIKSHGKLKILNENNIKINSIVQSMKRYYDKPTSRKTILKLIDFEKNNLDSDYIEFLSPIINKNLVWTPIKYIEKSQNWTYDFSLPNFPEEKHDFNHSVIYNQTVTHNTPNGLDPVYYKTFIGARKKENNFNAIEIWWFNDPRYNKNLVWLKNKGDENEIRIVDENWSDEHRIKLMDDGWEASSPWFEEQIRNANGDMRKINQEILCNFLGSGDNFINEKYLKHIEENEVIPPIRQEYNDFNMWIWEDPLAGEEYVMAIDASPGHGEDNSTINMLKLNRFIEEKVIIKNGIPKKIKIKRHKVEQVAEYYGKITPQMLAEVGYQFGKTYNDAYAVIDITGGYGVQAVEKLLEFGYENIHYAEVTHKPSRDRLSGYIKKGSKKLPDGNIIQVDLIPGFFIGNNRASVLLELQRAIHLKDIIIHSSRLLGELKTFVTVSGNRVADHKRSFHDDSIMGLSIGLYTISFDIVRFKQSKTTTENMLKALITANDVNEYAAENKIKPTVSSLNSPQLNKHLMNDWLFKGLDKRK